MEAKKSICLTCSYTFESCVLKHRSELDCCPVTVCFAHNKFEVEEVENTERRFIGTFQSEDIRLADNEELFEMVDSLLKTIDYMKKKINKVNNWSCDG